MQGLVDAFEGSRYHLMFAQTGYSEMLDTNVVSSVLPFRPAGVVCAIDAPLPGARPNGASPS